MRSCTVRFAATVLLLGIGLAHAVAQAAKEGERETATLAAREKQQCSTNLNTIFAAIQAYQKDHRDLPNWLSDLVPRYLPDANVLVCPLCRRTGKTEGPLLADPNISSSYLFEFCPLPLDGVPNRTRREWKRRQMGLVGSKVPLVRCRHHDRALNLAFDGTVYESPMRWEEFFTNQVSLAELEPGRLFANDNASGTAPKDATATGRKFPVRDLKAGKQLLDLSKCYNAMLTESWHGGTDNNLEALSAGVQNLAGVDFDIRGIIQLAGKAAHTTNWPAEAKGIQVRQKCQRLHFLHAAAWGHTEDEGKPIGSYVVHYATNRMRLEIPIVYGRTVRDWHAGAGEPPFPRELRIGWQGENGVSKRAKASIRLFLTTWNNVAPEIEIESIDFVSAIESSAPFLLGITAE